MVTFKEQGDEQVSSSIISQATGRYFSRSWHSIPLKTVHNLYVYCKRVTNCITGKRLPKPVLTKKCVTFTNFSIILSIPCICAKECVKCVNRPRPLLYCRPPFLVSWVTDFTVSSILFYSLNIFASTSRNSSPSLARNCQNFRKIRKSITPCIFSPQRNLSRPHPGNYNFRYILILSVHLCLFSQNVSSFPTCNIS